jgi:CheY-like chemotaxis protein
MQMAELPARRHQGLEGAGQGWEQPGSLLEALSGRVVGQPTAVASVVPCIQMHLAGLSPEGRPAGIFLLLGPTGTGKTRTVEAVAEVLHGSATHLLRVDCGEFQADHEVAKLTGAPPGYIGHRESEPVLTQQKLADITSAHCDLSLVLFDEIEKAAPSLTVLLLGILDKASLRLGDGSAVNFEKTIIFLTSNLGAREMLRELRPDIGFQAGLEPNPADVARRLESIGLAAVRRRFSPEFVNRLDAVITYRALDRHALDAILNQHIVDLQRHVDNRLGPRSFDLRVAPVARDFLVAKGTSTEYGARELKRTLHRHLVQPLAVLVASGDIMPGAEVAVDLKDDGSGLAIRVSQGAPRHIPGQPPTVLVADDNESLLGWLESCLSDVGCRVLAATSAEQALAHAGEHRVAAAFLDYFLPDDDGVKLGLRLRKEAPGLPVVIMTSGELPEDDAAICRRFSFSVLKKPFPRPEMLNLLDARVLRAGVKI